jgi:hypothetical protein
MNRSLAELAHRDPQPVDVTDLGHRVGGQVRTTRLPQAGAGQHLDDEPIAGQVMRPGRGHELGRVLVVEELRQRLGPGRDVAVEDRVAAGGVGPVPVE